MSESKRVQALHVDLPKLDQKLLRKVKKRAAAVAKAADEDEPEPEPEPEGDDASPGNFPTFGG